MPDPIDPQEKCDCRWTAKDVCMVLGVLTTMIFGILNHFTGQSNGEKLQQVQQVQQVQDAKTDEVKTTLHDRSAKTDAQLGEIKKTVTGLYHGQEKDK